MALADEPLQVLPGVGQKRRNFADARLDGLGARLLILEPAVLQLGIAAAVLDQLAGLALDGFEPPSAALKVDLVQSEESFLGCLRGVLARTLGILERAELFLPLALPHNEVVRELENVEDKLFELDAVVGGRRHRLLLGVAEERDLLLGNVVRQVVVVLMTNLQKEN